MRNKGRIFGPFWQPTKASYKMSHQFPIILHSLFPSRIQFFLGLILLQVLFGCANRGTLEGGSRDTEPPRLDSLNSTPNFQTNFRKQTISLAFNEWVELRDVFTQVVISPPLEFRPKIERRKKAIEIRFDEKEVLRDSATYVLNFGQSIIDLTEGNAANIVFVFSTGSYIDSLNVKGKVVDAHSGKPAEGVLFMLYENLADSAVRKERPFYFARTDKEGKYEVRNVKSGTFRAVAVHDPNQNYKYDGETEKIGFLDTALVVMPPPVAEITDTLIQDSTILEEEIPIDSSEFDSLKKKTPGQQYVIRLFEEEKQLFLRSKETSVYGIAKLIFNREPFEASYTYDSTVQVLFTEREKDSLKLWYVQAVDSSWHVYLTRDTIIDTVVVASGLKDSFLETATLSAPSSPTPTPSERIAPGKELSFRFNHPLAGFDVSKISLLQDTTRTRVIPQIKLDTLDKRTIHISYPWKESSIYNAQILPGGVTDIFGLANEDTIKRNFTAGISKDYGTLSILLKKLEKEKDYLVRILTSNSIEVISWKVSQVELFGGTIQMLSPGVYSVEVVEDLDKNGRWTTGSLDAKRQPERIFRKTLDQLRANWELVTDLELGFE